MSQISLTDLVDIVSKSGLSRAKKILQVKERPEYTPACDYYKDLRTKIIEVHKTSASKTYLQNYLGEGINPKKTENYKTAIVGYLKWWGHKDLNWFEPDRKVYSKKGVDVIVNPELGLIIDGQSHLIKLYFKNEPLSKLRIELIIALMRISLQKSNEKHITMSILDVRKSKFFSQTSNTINIQKILDAELGYIAEIWSEK